MRGRRFGRVSRSVRRGSPRRMSCGTCRTFHRWIAAASRARTRFVRVSGPARSTANLQTSRALCKRVFRDLFGCDEFRPPGRERSGVTRTQRCCVGHTALSCRSRVAFDHAIMRRNVVTVLWLQFHTNVLCSHSKKSIRDNQKSSSFEELVRLACMVICECGGVFAAFSGGLLRAIRTRASRGNGEGGIRTPDEGKPPYRISNPAHSTALPPLLGVRGRWGWPRVGRGEA